MIRFTDNSKPLDFFTGIKMSASTRRDDGTTTVTTRARQHTSAPVVAASHWLTAGREEGKRRAEEKEKDQTCCKSAALRQSLRCFRTVLILVGHSWFLKPVWISAYGMFWQPRLSLRCSPYTFLLLLASQCCSTMFSAADVWGVMRTLYYYASWCL